MTLVLDGRAATLLRGQQHLGIPPDARFTDLRRLPWWWVTLALLQKAWDSHLERASFDHEKLAIPRDYRVFLSHDWVDQWYEDRERQAREARRQRSEADT